MSSREPKPAAANDKKPSLSNKQKVSRLVLAGIFTALIALATLFVGFQAGKGYLHLGDGFILAASYLLGPWGMAAAGIGSVLADILKGYVEYAPATAIIKPLMALMALLFFRRVHSKKSFWLWGILGMAVAELTMVLGYFVYEGLLFGWSWAIVGCLPNLMQGGFGVITGASMIAMIQRVHKNGRAIDPDNR